MTDDEALAILSEREDRDLYIAMADDNGIEKPYFRKGSIVLRGDFFPEELEAILHFAPKQSEETLVEPMTEDERIAIAGDHELDRIGTEFWQMEREPGESSDSYRKRIQARKTEFKAWLRTKYAAEEWRGPTHEEPTTAPNIEPKL